MSKKILFKENNIVVYRVGRLVVVESWGEAELCLDSFDVNSEVFVKYFGDGIVIHNSAAAVSVNITSTGGIVITSIVTAGENEHIILDDADEHTIYVLRGGVISTINKNPHEVIGLDIPYRLCLAKDKIDGDGNAVIITIHLKEVFYCVDSTLYASSFSMVNSKIRTITRVAIYNECELYMPNKELNNESPEHNEPDAHGFIVRLGILWKMHDGEYLPLAKCDNLTWESDIGTYRLIPDPGFRMASDNKTGLAYAVSV